MLQNIDIVRWKTLSLNILVIFFFQLSVDGGWSDWIEESDDNCFESNGSWMKPRSRTCTNPEPLYGGICLEDESGVFNESFIECSPSEFWFLKATDVKLMNLMFFVVDGQFGEYGDWSKCSQSCTQFRERSCDNPEPAFGGKECTGETISSRFCVEDDCQSGNK